MKTTIMLQVSAVSLFLSAAAFAERVQSTTSTYVSLRNCVAGDTPCDSIDRPHAKAIGGTPGGTEAPASQSDPEFGEAYANAQLTGNPGEGLLTGNAKSLATKRNASTGFFLQRYTNESDIAQTLEFKGMLTYEQSVPLENSAFPEKGGGRSGTNVEMDLFTIDADSVEAGTTAEDNYGVFDAGPPAGYRSLSSGKAGGSVSNETAKGSETVTMTAAVEPGQSVWMFTLLQAIAANGAVVDAELETSLTITSD